MKIKPSSIMIALAACLWGCMGLLVRTLNEEGLSTMEMVGCRSFVTFVLMLFGTLIFDRDALKVKKKDIWCFLGTGMISVVFFNFCYFYTIQLTSLSVAAILLYTSPFFVTALSSIVFHERITIKKIICVVIAFLGCGLVSGALSGNLVLSLKGLFIGLGAGLGYALYSIFGKIATNKEYSSITVTLYTFAFASVGTLPFVKISNISAVFTGNIKIVLLTFLLIILTTVIPYLCYTYGLSRTQPGIAAILATIEPVAATAVGMIFYREIPGFITIIGMMLVFGAVVMISYEDCTKKNTKK